MGKLRKSEAGDRTRETVTSLQFSYEIRGKHEREEGNEGSDIGIDITIAL